MKRNWVRRIIGGISFTSALFVFQACYGTPQDFGFDLFIEGQVKSASTGLPVKGIKNDCLGNGLHNWHGDKSNVLVCHHQKLMNT